MNQERRNMVMKSHLLRERVSLMDADYQKACLSYFNFQKSLDLPGKSRDITSDIVLSEPKKIVQAVLLVKEDGMIAGLEEVQWYLKQQKEVVEVFTDCADGEFVRRGRRSIYIKGEASYILATERHIVNFVQRMSGIATQAYELIGAAASINPYVLVCSTRKTYFGPLDKKAVVIAGGGTHRVYLSDAILVKENHFEFAACSFLDTLHKLSHHKENIAFVEVEVETPDQAIKAAQVLLEIKKNKFSHVPFGLMLDNFSPQQIKPTLGKMLELGLYENLFFEASGGINSTNLADYVNSGVDLISMGALTNNSPSLDMSLEIL